MEAPSLAALSRYLKLQAFRSWKRVLCKPGFRDIPLERILLGRQGGLSGKDFATALGRLDYTSTQVPSGPHADLLRRARRGPTLSDDEILSSPYGKMATVCIRATGSYFGARDSQGVVDIAREFVSADNGSRLMPRPDRSGENDPIVVAPVRRSYCYQLVDGHHRAARLAVSGVRTVRARVRWFGVETALQAHVRKMSWLRGRQELYQPLDVPELPVDRWPLVRRCTDRLAKMEAFLGERGITPPASYLDVASFYGWFVSEMGKRGFDAEGLERDPMAPTVGECVYGLPASAVHVADAEEWLLSCGRTWDVVSCFSLLHHFILRFGEESAADFLRLLASVTGRVLFIDSGQETEKWYQKSLEGWAPARIQEFLASTVDWEEVVDLGPDEDAVPPFEQNYGRHLFACVRRSHPA